MATIKTMVIGGIAIESQVKRDADTGDYVVRVRKAEERKWYEPADYWTNDKRDALDTQVAMMHNYREYLS